MLWFACAVLVVLAGFFILTPLFRERSGADEGLRPETELDRLLNRKTVVYSNLKDLELEYKMGRLSDADFQQLGTGYKNEAAAILYRIDEIRASEGRAKTIAKDSASRKPRRTESGARQGRDLSRCPSCGAEVIPGKKFCPDCGHRF